MGITLALKRRTVIRLAGGIFVFYLLLRLLFPSSAPKEIAHHNYIERFTKGVDKYLDVQKHEFLQARIGRDEHPDMLSDYVDHGTEDFWTRFQIPFMNSQDTSHIDAQALRSSIEDLLSLHGWVAADCPTLNRPFGLNKFQDAYDDLAENKQMYYIAIIIHSADHFLVDQLATIVQLARKLGTRNLFVSMLDYHSQDSTETLTDLSEAVLTLLGIPFRIRRVPTLTVEEKAGYYPLEEAYTRNLALEPLHELRDRRKIKFDKVIWLKGFTCPNDILETIKVTVVNKAAMTCGMDWAENNGFFVFSDRWRTRDMDGDQFRVSRSVSTSAPPREEVAAKRYAQHLPFQVFCCESGTHVVDPAQTYYRGIKYRHSFEFFNTSAPENLSPPTYWNPYGECMDSAQAWFCRDIWVSTAEEGVKLVDQPVKPTNLDAAASEKARRTQRRTKRQADDVVDPQVEEAVAAKADAEAEIAEPPAAAPPDDAPPAVGGAPLVGKPGAGGDKIKGAAAPPEDVYDDDNPAPGGKAPSSSESDADRGSDFDTVPEASPPPLDDDVTDFSVPNSDFEAARILINPRCVTTYAGVSHTKLANDLFGPDSEDGGSEFEKNRYELEEWAAAPDSYVCQEQRFTGGRKSPKNQRSSPFSIDLVMTERKAKKANKAAPAPSP